MNIHKSEEWLNHITLACGALGAFIGILRGNSLAFLGGAVMINIGLAYRAAYLLPKAQKVQIVVRNKQNLEDALMSSGLVEAVDDLHQCWPVEMGGVNNAITHEVATIHVVKCAEKLVEIWKDGRRA
ncbi:hypothetical protein [Cardiobacterium hominis]|uniref:hypothetical protein n=1 Tax=Cardiobacterium hominis TaxID=2718 RepID=UPI0028D82F8E|nr:hypothetical protein [Cardiobacterium hominis]